ncbi:MULTISPECIES: acyl carrier protein [Aerococcus]|uniref:acyl carrier protein n=1 Tax=Aerococcus TaxID=1375 RepID=UPI0018A706AD|nr:MULTISPECIES: acyl carrier protein [Aerococcus]MCY3035259.1 acyl carrier protein [Aerococcus sp. Group 2]MCY3038682.1 acyl carrier protein [Aerococcus sp. Group 2]MCY3040837.1 acyl carrier protein [Aerococcus sp. Group 2]MCY3042074.1 acyl carrier protein [Aerococcus sp. Group 2]MDK6521070.1 acyl carrier protein [Aerococcus urinae]
MEERKIFDIIREMISERFGLEDEKIDKTTHLSKDLGADSLDIVELVMTLEDYFKVSIPDSTADHIETLEELVDAISLAKKG